MNEIKFYKTQSGKIPVKEFLDSLSFKHAQKVIWVLELVERLDQIPVQYFYGRIAIKSEELHGKL